MLHLREQFDRMFSATMENSNITNELELVKINDKVFNIIVLNWPNLQDLEELDNAQRSFIDHCFEVELEKND